MKTKSNFYWRLEKWAIFLIICGTVAVSAMQHWRAGLTLPLPWPDEASFLWQAVSWGEHTTLFSPEINPHREVFWMPPGYAVVTGFLAKIFGFSLVKVRWFSWVYSVVFYFGLLRLLWFRELRLFTVFIVSAFFLGTLGIVLGNVGRMEALLLAVITWAMVSLRADRPWLGLPLLVVSGLIHPNAIYFFAAAVAWCVYKYWGDWPRWRLADTLVAGAVVVVLGFYAWHALAQWPAFHEDMHFQFLRKNSRNIFNSVFSATRVNYLFLYLIVGLLSFFIAPWLLLPWAFGLAAGVIFDIGLEMWYAVFTSLSVIVLAVVSLQIVAQLVLRFGRKWSGSWRYLIIGGLAVWLVFWCWRLEAIVEVPEWPRKIEWRGMEPAGRGSYFNNEDRVKLSAALAQAVGTNAPIKLFVFPEGDSLFLWPYPAAVYQPLLPHFCEDVPDAILVHWSVSNDASVRKRFRQLPSEWGLGRDALNQWESRNENIIYSRGGTDKWFFKELKPRKQPGPA